MPDLSTEHARHFFSTNGFAVHDIPTAGELGQKRADLRVTAGAEEYTVEAKEREPHRDWQVAAQKADLDGFASISRDIRPWWLLGKRIAEAREQLVATPASPDAFRVLWVVALHGDAQFVTSCYEKQLLGRRLLMAFRPEYFADRMTDAVEAWQCLYFDDNDFERYPELDAAMLCTPAGGQLLVNHFSPNRERFRSSRLYSIVDQYGAVLDAEVLVRNRRALMIDTDFRGPRGQGAQQTYLEEKYGLLVSVAQESQFHGVAVFTPPDKESG